MSLQTWLVFTPYKKEADEVLASEVITGTDASLHLGWYDGPRWHSAEIYAPGQWERCKVMPVPSKQEVQQD